MDKIVVNTAFGHVKIEAEDQKICRLDLTNEPTVSSSSPVLNQAANQIIRYFNGESIQFDLPLNPIGTTFQRAVWQALTEIPFGETRSYQAIASTIGNIKAVRAVGGAVNKNPIMIVIPCHRVIGKDGSLVGFYGGLELKQRLLDLEKR